MPSRKSTSETRQIGTGLARIGDALRSQAWQQGAELGLTPTQARALALIGASPDGVGLTALARGLGVSAPSASETVKALVARNLVAKVRGTDRRATILTLTDEGETVANGVEGWPGFLEDAVAALPADDRTALLRGVSQVIRTLQEQGGIDPQRQCLTCRYFQPNRYAGSARPHHCGFVDAPFGDSGLRIDCPDHEAAAV
ncbi:MarR family winged helix-turn-helix transcriptional regulator [Hyphobacterium marinum]|uniref:MarR family winged helix-turn-helix transcriptional regulator n=1 Tax=Hyphobacterium marinum TaxID=3116574 RepID=A0ABU7M055_9PROT|nr:MarR family winged helix-turn-helix transcriptional regulator [Hyphobacterium sp. Y6023]MEE2567155.1 MarR family winged helix-turn-helix transcriptional regulator [Hyphobacterium sp. Y6023]